VEYDERCEAAWAARTGADLRPLFADLPGAQQHQRPAAPPPSRSRGRWPVPLVPVLAILVGLTLLTHVQWLLIGLLAWFLLSRGACRRW
jgi:hypothetical protein